ncbi:hypothetical protein PAMP_019326 [Pampus punctatissimus]
MKKHQKNYDLMLPAIAMETEASHMLEAALEQMDDIIAGSKAAAVEFSNSMYDLGSPVSAGPLQVVQIAEDLKLALELQPNQEDRDSLRAQLPTETAQALIDWLQGGTRNRIKDAAISLPPVGFSPGHFEDHMIKHVMQTNGRHCYCEWFCKTYRKWKSELMGLNMKMIRHRETDRWEER